MANAPLSYQARRHQTSAYLQSHLQSRLNTYSSLRKGLCCLIFTIGVAVHILFTFSEELSHIQWFTHSPLLSHIGDIEFSSHSSLRLSSSLLSSSLLSSSPRYSLIAQDVFQFSSFQIARATATPTRKKSLIVGIDGTAGRAVQEIINDKCRYPHSGFRDLVHRGTRWDTGGSGSKSNPGASYSFLHLLLNTDVGDKTPTKSGPGWASIITGVKAESRSPQPAKHMVPNNDFTYPVNKVFPFPDYCKVLTEELGVKESTVKSKQVGSQGSGGSGASTGSSAGSDYSPRVRVVDTWGPISNEIFGSRVEIDSISHANSSCTSGESYLKQDEKVFEIARRELGNEDYDSFFYHFDQVDVRAHYDLGNQHYLLRGRLQLTGFAILQLIEVVKKRATFQEESWVMVVVSDHGTRIEGGVPAHGSLTDAEKNAVMMVVPIVGDDVDIDGGSSSSTSSSSSANSTGNINRWCVPPGPVRTQLSSVPSVADAAATVVGRELGGRNYAESIKSKWKLDGNCWLADDCSVNGTALNGPTNFTETYTSEDIGGEGIVPVAVAFAVDTFEDVVGNAPECGRASGGGRSGGLRVRFGVWWVESSIWSMFGSSLNLSNLLFVPTVVTLVGIAIGQSIRF